MRCMHSYAECLNDLGRVSDSISVFEEMIRLNPNDNQGVRDQLLLHLIRLNEFNKFRKYIKCLKKIVEHSLHLIGLCSHSKLRD